MTRVTCVRRESAHKLRVCCEPCCERASKRASFHAGSDGCATSPPLESIAALAHGQPRRAGHWPRRGLSPAVDADQRSRSPQFSARERRRLRACGEPAAEVANRHRAREPSAVRCCLPGGVVRATRARLKKNMPASPFRVAGSDSMAISDDGWPSTAGARVMPSCWTRLHGRWRPSCAASGATRCASHAENSAADARFVRHIGDIFAAHFGDSPGTPS